MRSALPDGPTIATYGQALARASHFPWRARSEALPTTGTCGPNGSGLSASAVLQRSLESKLRVQLIGSVLCAVTWKAWVTSSGQCRSKPRARVRSISGTAIGLWPTPDTMAGPHGTRGISTNPAHQSARDLQATTWATPVARDWRSDRSQKTGEELYGMKGRPLARQAMEAATWVSPIATDAHRGVLPPRPHDTGIPLSQQIEATLNGSNVQTENLGQLNPEFVCWLMGYPQEWVNCAPSAMPSSRKSRQNSLKHAFPWRQA